MELYHGVRVYLKITLFFLALAQMAVPSARATKPLALKGPGTACVLLSYDFDVLEKDFPNLNLPDNALLLLKGAEGVCEPMSLSVEQNGNAHPPVGSESMFLWGAFHVVFFDTGFDKFVPYVLTAPCGKRKCNLKVGPAELTSLIGGAKKRGKREWRDPITDDMIQNAHPLELAELLSRGRGLEYANEALFIMRKGGLPRLRREARTALEAGAAMRAACLATMALKWAPSAEPAEALEVSMFQDWVLVGRAFRAMKRPLAAIRAYKEALKIRRERVILDELRQARAEYNASKKRTVTRRAYKSGLSEVELEYGAHGKIPIPKSDYDVVQGGVKANGVYLGDHRDRVVAQCGEPDEVLSGALLYFNHPICPEAIFISPSNRAYSIRTRRGKTPRGIAVGDSLRLVAKRLGKPDRKDPIKDNSGKTVGVKWVYNRLKLAFIDVSGNGRVDAIEVFDFSLVP